jgi:DNA end-binding protein Ku
MPQMIWKGHITFGLVSIPVALYPAAQSRDVIDFTLLDKKDMSPIGYRKVSKATGEEVPRERITRGFEYGKGRYVIVSDADLRRASPERTQQIAITAFVDPAEVQAKYFDRPYYLEAVPKQEKGYALLRETMRKSGKMAIATVVIHTRQHLAALMAEENALVLDLLRYPQELRDPSHLTLPGKSLKTLDVSDKELKMAERLVEQMVEPWEPSKYRDEYRDELTAFIRKRAKAGKIEEPEVEEPAARKAGKVIDIMSLLKQSVDKAEKGRPRARGRKSA